MDSAVARSRVTGPYCIENSLRTGVLSPGGVKVFPFKTVETGAVINSSIVWESRGARSLFGLGDHVKVSALIERVQDLVEGRMLVFCPGEVV